MNYQTLAEIGIRIKAARHRQGIEIATLARITGMSAEEVSKIERGAWDISILEVQRLTKALGITVAGLLGEKY